MHVADDSSTAAGCAESHLRFILLNQQPFSDCFFLSMFGLCSCSFSGTWPDVALHSQHLCFCPTLTGERKTNRRSSHFHAREFAVSGS